MSWGDPPAPPPPPPPPPGGGYPPPGYGYGYGQPRPSSTNGFAIAALVLGIVGLVAIIFLVPSVLALVFGLVARSQINERGEQGKGMAVAGIVLGAIGIAVFVLFIILVVAVGDDSSTSNYGLSAAALLMTVAPVDPG